MGRSPGGCESRPASGIASSIRGSCITCRRQRGVCRRVRCMCLCSADLDRHMHSKIVTQQCPCHHLPHASAPAHRAEIATNGCICSGRRSDRSHRLERLRRRAQNFAVHRPGQCSDAAAADVCQRRPADDLPPHHHSRDRRYCFMCTASCKGGRPSLHLMLIRASAWAKIVP